MSVNTNTTMDYDNGGYPTLETSFSRIFKFSLLVTGQILSACCSLIIFYAFVRLRELHSKPHNHVVLCLLICNFLITTLELPVTLVYIYYGQLIPASFSLCLFWIFMNYFLFPTSAWIMAVASLQRYFFIFHKQLVNTHLKHYLPIVLPPVILFAWYVGLVFFYPCQQQFDYTQVWCLGACYLYEGTIGSIDWILSTLVPILLTVIFNILLLIRVIHQKVKMQRGHIWRSTRKLSLQLFSISFLFLAICLPLTIFGLIRLWFDPFFLFVVTMVYFAYAVYLVPLLMPFICLISMPQVKTRIRNFCCCLTPVEPMTLQGIPMTFISKRRGQPTRHPGQ